MVVEVVGVSLDNEWVPCCHRCVRVVQWVWSGGCVLLSAQAKKLMDLGKVDLQEEMERRGEELYTPNWFSVELKTGVGREGGEGRGEGGRRGMGGREGEGEEREGGGGGEGGRGGEGKWLVRNKYL